MQEIHTFTFTDNEIQVLRDLYYHVYSSVQDSLSFIRRTLENPHMNYHTEEYDNYRKENADNAYTLNRLFYEYIENVYLGKEEIPDNVEDIIKRFTIKKEKKDC